MLGKLFRKKCKHQWVISDTSNAIQYDTMGYTVRLCIYTCKHCGKSEQRWLDSTPRINDVNVVFKPVNS